MAWQRSPPRQTILEAVDLVYSRSNTLERSQPASAGFGCARCNHYIEPRSKFCGNCGESASLMVHPQSQTQSQLLIQSQTQGQTLNQGPGQNQYQSQQLPQYPGHVPNFTAGHMFTGGYVFETPSAAARQMSNQANMAAENFYRSERPSTPSFAVPKRKKAVPPELREEMNSINMSMVRERFFLIFHYCVFLVTNLIGLAMAIKCYCEYIGDDVTKIMIASTPILFINLCALVCLVPIKGTKAEIARLKDRMTNVKLRLEFDSLI